MEGLIHIYCGDGKGKTTAAVGLAIRGAGAGKRVLFAQFLKGGTSSEIAILQQIPDIRVVHPERHYGFWKHMTQAQREETRVACCGLLDSVWKEAEQVDLLVLDEGISACNHAALEEKRLIGYLKEKPTGLEVVITGRNPSQELIDMADYVTEMKKIKHPFDRGIGARRGVEF